MRRRSHRETDPARREIVLALGSFAAAGWLGCASDGSMPTSASSPSPSPSSSSTSAACVVRPQQTEGPFFVDERLDRSDIRTDPGTGTVSPGVPLLLTFVVSRASNGGCTPLAGPLVDVWHCDAGGVYSDVGSASGARFLRGYQVTDAAGTARFTTVYPGWYAGRAVHIHFKIRNSPTAARGFEFTSQLYFDEALTDVVHARPPYNTRGRRTTTNQTDGIFASGGSQLLLAAAPEGSGYAATFNVALQV